ncbi:MAG: YncE family protein [Paludibacteraceae bacterium]
MKTKIFTVLILAVSFITSCKDVEDITTNVNLPIATDNLLVLSEGSFNQSNSTLAYYNLETKTSDNNYFQTKNGRGLGETANDIVKYGSKIYIVINGSSQIEVINAKTGVSVKQIPMFNGTIGKQPRYVAAYGGKVYVSSYDDTVTRIDTTSLSIDGSVAVGRDPEQLCITNNKIYVTNSGGMEYATGNYDNTVSIIDIATFKRTGKITVGMNPTKIKADDNGNLFVLSKGNYVSEFAKFQKIDTKTNTVKVIENVQVENFTIYENKIYLYQYNFFEDGSHENIISVLDGATGAFIDTNFISDDTKFEKGSYLYSINIDAYAGDVYVTNTDYIENGNVYCFDKNGKFKYKIIGVGMNPNNIVFLGK